MRRARPVPAEHRPPALPKPLLREHGPVRHPLSPNRGHLARVHARPNVILYHPRAQVVHHLRRDGDRGHGPSPVAPAAPGRPQEVGDG